MPGGLRQVGPPAVIELVSGEPPQIVGAATVPDALHQVAYESLHGHDRGRYNNSDRLPWPAASVITSLGLSTIATVGRFKHAFLNFCGVLSTGRHPVGLIAADLARAFGPAPATAVPVG